MKKEEEKVTEQIVANRLSSRYQSSAYAFLKRVRNQTGYSKASVRTADALAMSLWPSRGIHLEGFEIKIARSDWLKELSEPLKADEIGQFCNYWWIVVHDAKIVNLSEVPQNWGLIVAGKSGNKVIKDAPFISAKAPDAQLLAGIMRNVCENFVHRDDIHLTIETQKKRWEENGNYELKTMREDMKRLEAFKEASGIDPLDGYNKEKKIGAAVRLILDMDNNLGWKFKSAYDYLKSAVENFEKAGEEIKGIIELK